MSCVKLVSDLANAVTETTDDLITNMCDPKTNYSTVCFQSNVSYDFFYQMLRVKWNLIVEEFLDPNNGKKCKSTLFSIENLMFAASTVVPSFKDVGDILDIIKKSASTDSILDEDIGSTVINLSSLLIDNCRCQIMEMVKMGINKYRRRYMERFAGMEDKKIEDIIKKDINKLINNLKSVTGKNLSENTSTSLIDKLSNIYSFSIEGEMDKLIPDDFGPMKDFFTRIVVAYYGNLHPIIWAQIFDRIINSFFVVLPISKKELFSLVSGEMLLNSGPFILKMLQMVRPVLSQEIAEKYNLTKLTYPLLTKNQVNIILKNSIRNWQMINVHKNFSASVGHVCLVSRADDPYHEFIIKIIKPLSVAQSCWEYSVLSKVFPKDSCEHQFITDILKSNGREMNVNNEIENINKGFRYYTADYHQVFKKHIGSKLTTVEVIDGIVKENEWLVMAMTKAPGVPLNYLIENNLLNNDTPFRARLHRCMDLLYYKFITNIIQNSFYHGDLHSGNIFFSYEDNQMTLIDFGAIGNLDIFENTDIIHIIMMSAQNNYTGMLDLLTDMMNNRCQNSGEIVDKNSKEYLDLQSKLKEYQEYNAINHYQNGLFGKKYKEYIFGNERFSLEKPEEPTDPKTLVESRKIMNDWLTQTTKDDEFSIYHYYDTKPPTKTMNDYVIENRDVIPEPDIKKEVNSIGAVEVLNMIIKFFSVSGVNISVKFNELYELQKAYLLLLGVMKKIKYDGLRASAVANLAIKDIHNIRLSKLTKLPRLFKLYREEVSKNDHFVDNMISKIDKMYEKQ